MDEINNSRKHQIQIGKLVELDSGARLFVVHHGRDCDGAPLYELSPDKDDTTQEKAGFRNRGWFGGFLEDSLKVIYCVMADEIDQANINYRNLLKQYIKHVISCQGASFLDSVEYDHVLSDADLEELKNIENELEAG